MSKTTRGIVTRIKGGKAVLHDPNHPSRRVRVPRNLIEEHGLVHGATVAGEVRDAKKGPVLTSVHSICDLAPAKFRQRPEFSQLVAISPMERFPLSITGDASTRIIDLVAPIGKGTRGLIVSPPKAGKTMLLEEIAQAIRTAEPETRIVIPVILSTTRLQD